MLHQVLEAGRFHGAIGLPQVEVLETPWFWALNGVFGVLASALAVFVAIYFSISVNFLLGAFCYLALIPLLNRMVAARAA